MSRLDSGFAALSFDRVTFSAPFIIRREHRATDQVDEAVMLYLSGPELSR